MKQLPCAKQYVLGLRLKTFFSVWLLSVLHGHSFFHPCHNGQWPPTSKDWDRFYPLHLFSYLNSWERASISLLNATQGHYWYHFYVFGMTRSLTGDWTREPPSKASTLPLGYRGCGLENYNNNDYLLREKIFKIRIIFSLFASHTAGTHSAFYK